MTITNSMKRTTACADAAKNKIYSLGDAITIKVARANLEKKQLDFALV